MTGSLSCRFCGSENVEEIDQDLYLCDDCDLRYGDGYYFGECSECEREATVAQYATEYCDEHAPES